MPFTAPGNDYNFKCPDCGDLLQQVAWHNQYVKNDVWRFVCRKAIGEQMHYHCGWGQHRFFPKGSKHKAIRFWREGEVGTFKEAAH